MPPASSQQNTATGSLVTPASIGSAVLLGAFFLPWIKLFGKGVGGYQLREIWTVGPYLWSIPILSALVILLGICKQSNVGLGRVVGALPFLFLAIALNEFGSKLPRELALGAWLTLVSGAFLLMGLSSDSGKPTDVVKVASTPSAHENR